MSTLASLALRALLVTPLAATGSAQGLLLAVEDQNDTAFLVELAHDGTLVNTSSGVPPSASYLADPNYLPNGDWAAISNEGIEVFDGATGQHAQTIPLPLETFPRAMRLFDDGRLAINGFSSVLRVYDAGANWLDEWGFNVCPAGPFDDYDVDAQGHVWIAEHCASEIHEYDDAGTLLQQWTLPEQLTELRLADDGSLWGLTWNFDALHVDRSGVELGRFTVPYRRALAIDADGSLWVSGEHAGVVQRYAPDGTPVNELALPGPWSVWGIDVEGELPSLGAPYCHPANLNSTGASGTLAATGFSEAALNYVQLQAGDLPVGEAGFFLVSQTQAFVPFPGGSQGNLCLGGAIGRYSASVWVVGASGSLEAFVDVTQIPTPNGTTSAVAGETWNWQAWYRDHNPGSTSNFTNGVSILFL